jgi:hypothetical protein
MGMSRPAGFGSSAGGGGGGGDGVVAGGQGEGAGASAAAAPGASSPAAQSAERAGTGGPAAARLSWLKSPKPGGLFHAGSGVASGSGAGGGGGGGGGGLFGRGACVARFGPPPGSDAGPLAHGDPGPVSSLLQGLPEGLFSLQRGLAPVPQKRQQQQQRLSPYSATNQVGLIHLSLSLLFPLAFPFPSPPSNLNPSSTPPVSPPLALPQGRHASPGASTPNALAPPMPVEQAYRESYVDAQLARAWHSEGLAWARMDVHGVEVARQPLEEYEKRCGVTPFPSGGGQRGPGLVGAFLNLLLTSTPSTLSTPLGRT